MNKAKNPSELVDRYLQAVHFWLPKTRGQEEVLAELGEDLRSQIEAHEQELGRALDVREASEILKRCGAPMVVASRLGPKRSLIGPALYPVYTFVLRMVLLWILIPVFLFIVGPVNVANRGGDWGTAIAITIGNLWSGLFIAAGIITLVFAIVERSSAHAVIACKWDPASLPPLQEKTERTPSLATTVSQLIFGVFGLIWLLLLPRYPVLILGPAALFLKASPVIHTLFLPLVLLAFLSLLKSAITLARPQWTWFPPVAELVQSVCILAVINFLVDAAQQTPRGAWYPYVTLADAVSGSVQYVKIAAIVNLSILLCLVCSWLGLGIALIVQLWALLLRKRKPLSAQQSPFGVP